MILLEMKESLQIVYARYSAAINAALKFALSFLFLIFLRHSLGFFSNFNSLPILAVISVVCAILPYGAICFVMAVVLLAHVYEVSLEIALISAAVLFMIGLIYFGFQPDNAFWLILTPLAFFFRIPYVIPLVAGLSGSLSCIFPACCGVIVYYLVDYISLNASAIRGDVTTDIIEKCIQMIEGLITDREMIFFVLAFAAGILIVGFVHGLFIDYAWAIAVALGALGQIIVLLIGDFCFDVSVSVAGLIAGMAAAIVITAVYVFFVYMVDYSQTEKLQFEDDDYVYYVKAVPKIAARRRREPSGHAGDRTRSRR